MSSGIELYISRKKELIDEELSKVFVDHKDRLSQSMMYSTMAGGKRLRAVLCLAACETFGGSCDPALPAACAIEMIHTYSLIHDDLPAMDNDDIRRGVKTNHKEFGEATAILAGDALLTDAFNLIARTGPDSGLSGESIVKIINIISHAAGSKGMVLGQAIDLGIENGSSENIEFLKKMHSLKTGALIEASVVAGAIAGGAGEGDLEHLKRYAGNIGLAYQIIDDVIDDEGHNKTGKTRGSDKNKNKTTFKTLLGTEKSFELTEELTLHGIKSLEGINHDTSNLENLARYLGQRTH